MLACKSYGRAVGALCPAFMSTKAPYSRIATVSMSTKENKKQALWQEQGLMPGKRAPTEFLFRQSLKRIFPNEEIIFEARKVLNIKRAVGAGFLEIDASIPRLKFHAEYQDPYHYTTSLYYSNRPLAEIQESDAYKKRCLDERGETLLQLPCWWDGTDESLIATIKSIRPDLLQHLNPSCQPVSDTPPNDFFRYTVVPDVGPLKRPVFFTEKYYKLGNVWLGTEKLDGVRCCWNPKRQKLYSRQGNELRFLEQYKSMPDAFLDGEVWFGRQQYQEAAKLVGTRTGAINWPDFRIAVFDVAGVSQLVYSERYKLLLSLIPADHPFLFIPPMIQINSEERRSNLENQIGKIGGEGMILTEMNSLYEPGQTSKVLKVKPSLDKEALVVSSDREFLTLKLTDGIIFRTRIPDNVQPPPRVGDVITFTYNRSVQGTTLPEKPQILRVRSDVTWDDLVLSESEGIPLRDISLGRDYSMRWDRNLDDLRGCFTKFAQDNCFDPLVPDNWYSVRYKDIVAILGARYMLKSFNGSVVYALMASFPDIGLDKSKFSYMPKGHWKDNQNVRKWLDQFAEEEGFDPLIAQNWYAISSHNLKATKSARSALKRFNGEHIDAIISAYPEIGIDKSQFSTSNTLNVRKWFDQFAKQHGFDPLVARNWYKISRSDIFAAKKNANSMLRPFNFSHINAIAAVYPEIGIDKSKFESGAPNNYWKDLQNIKKWFDELAIEKGFDPLVVSNWHRTDIMGKKGASGVLEQFKGSYTRALSAVYPGFNEELESPTPKNYWKNLQNVKQWFDEFAKEKGFDPLVTTNWYNVHHSDILAKKGAFGLRKHFNGSPFNALSVVYPGIDISKFKYKWKSTT